MTKEERFRSVYTNLKDKVYRFCLGYMGNVDDASDLYQEVLIKVWNNLDNFRNKSSIDTWVYRIASNTALSHLRKRQNESKKKSHVNIQSVELPVDEDQALNSENKVSDLYSAIATLKEIERVLITMVLEGHSYEEIAEVTGLSISNVGVRLNRTKKALNSKLQKS